MSDAERLVEELRRCGEPALARARAKLGPDGRRAWDSLRTQVDRAFPGWTFRSRLARLFSWSKR
jgi:hypothetical protein